MSVLKKIAASTSVALIAGLALTGSTVSSAEAATSGVCKGMTAVKNTNPLNQAPVATNDTVKIVAGDVARLKVLGNDSDPDGNRLFVVSLSTPGKGEACINSTGTIEYNSEISTTSYVQNFTYGITDGDFYRTARLSVTVEGVKPVTAQVTQRLKKKGKKRSQRAHITFTNPGKRWLFFAAGSPNKERPAIQRTLAPGQSAVLVTKQRRILFISARVDSEGWPLLVGYGLVRTKTGRIITGTFEDEEFRKAPLSSAQARRWLS
jgi:hypothetical protein